MMAPRIFPLLLLLSFVLGSCFPQGSLHNVRSMDEGHVILYLQPLSQEAYRLRFVIGEISAIRDDGTLIPLFLSINEIKGTGLVAIQKRLASGGLPPGSYTGLSIRIKDAFVQGEEGEFALLVPEEPTRVDSLFNVTRRKTAILFLSFHVAGAITDQVRFTPAFSLKPSARELLNLTGYVSDPASDSLLVFNKKTMQVVGAISTGTAPKGIALDRNRGRAYVAAYEDDTVEVIDVIEGEIIGRIPLNFGDGPLELAVAPDGRTLVSVNHDSNTVSIIDTVSLFEIRRVRVAEGPSSAVVDPPGLKAYVMSPLANSVSVVDLTQSEASATIAVEGGPLRGAFNREGDTLYVVSRDSPYLTVIDASRLVITQRIFIGIGALSIKVDTQTDLILVGMKAGGNILVIDAFASMAIDAIVLEGNAAYLTIDDEENSLFVALPDIKSLQKVNLTSKKITGAIDVGEEAYAVVVVRER